MSSSLGILFTVGATLGASVASAFSTVSGSVKDLQSRLDQLQAVSLHSGALIDADSKLKSIQSKLSAGPYLPVTQAALTKQLDAARLSFEQAQRAANGYGVTVGNMEKNIRTPRQPSDAPKQCSNASRKNWPIKAHGKSLQSRSWVRWARPSP